MDKLFDFTATLPEDIQHELSGKKPLGIIKILERQGISIPNDIIEEFEQEQENCHNHDRIMDGMRPYAGNDVYTIKGLVVNI